MSRGGEKLQRALDSLDVPVDGRDCADVGASTGGFTDCSLQAGAKRVVASTSATASSTRACGSDPASPFSNGRTPATSTELPFAPELVVCDVSFISVVKALPPGLALAQPGWKALVLVKPQFEAGARTWARASCGTRCATEGHRDVIEAAREWGGDTVGVVDSGLPGPKGNREFFVHLVNRAAQSHTDDIDRWIAEAVG